MADSCARHVEASCDRRIRASSRHAAAAPPRRRVVHLANRPFQVLLHLVANRDRLVPRAELLEQFWDGRDVYEDALTRCMSTVRKALVDQGSPARYIETRWAEGYRFVGPCEDRDGQALAPAAATALHGAGVTCVYTSRRRGAADRLVRRGNAYLGRSGLRNQSLRARDVPSRASQVNPDDFRAWRTAGWPRAMRSSTSTRSRPTSTGAAAIAAAADGARARARFSRSPARARPGRRHARGLMEADVAFGTAESLEPRPVPRSWYYHGRGCAGAGRPRGRAGANYMRASAAESARLPGDGARRVVVPASRPAATRRGPGTARLMVDAAEAFCAVARTTSARCPWVPACCRTWTGRRRPWLDRTRRRARAARAVRQLQRGLRPISRSATTIVRSISWSGSSRWPPAITTGSCRIHVWIPCARIRCSRRIRGHQALRLNAA